MTTVLGKEVDRRSGESAVSLATGVIARLGVRPGAESRIYAT